MNSYGIVLNACKTLFFILSYVMLGFFIGCVPNRKIAPKLPSITATDCDSIQEVLNEIVPRFDEKWQADSIGCAGFRAQRVFMQSHYVLKGSGLHCVLDILGKPNIQTKDKNVTTLMYFIFNSECEIWHHTQQLILSFNNEDVLYEFGLVIE
jgi:hypothetical protein